MEHMTITEFLEARIAEDEAEATEYQHYEDQVYETAGWFDCTRVLAECAAKRAILAEHPVESRSSYGLAESKGCTTCNWERDYGWDATGPCATLRALAAVYKDHPDYQQEWVLGD